MVVMWTLEGYKLLKLLKIILCFIFLSYSGKIALKVFTIKHGGILCILVVQKTVSMPVNMPGEWGGGKYEFLGF